MGRRQVEIDEGLLQLHFPGLIIPRKGMLQLQLGGEANAVAEFIERYRREGITEKLDEIYGAEEGADSGLDPNLEALQLKTLAKEDW